MRSQPPQRLTGGGSQSASWRRSASRLSVRFWNTAGGAAGGDRGKIPELVPLCPQCPVTYVPEGAESTAERARNSQK